MSVQVENLEKNMAKMTIEVPAEEVTKAIQEAYKRNKSRFNVPGFRRGKVPQKMIEKMYGAGVFTRTPSTSCCPPLMRRHARRAALRSYPVPRSM